MRYIFITGASTGSGRCCALELARAGFGVFAGVRKEIDAQSLAADSNQAITPLQVDVTQTGTIAGAIETIRQKTGADGLTGLINNAGIAVVGPVEFVSLDEWRRQFEVNFFGAIAVTQAALPLLRQHAETNGKGAARLINISSIAGKIAQPILGPYTASKHAMESLTDSLRMELAPQGIKVCSVNPGAIDTPIWNKAQTEVAAVQPEDPPRKRYGPLIDGITAAAKKSAAQAVPPSQVAAAVLHCLNSKNPKTRYYVGKDARGAATMKWLLPDKWFDRLLERLIKN